MTEPKGLLSSDNPYSCRDEIEKWLAWDTAWHRLALEVASVRQRSFNCQTCEKECDGPDGGYRCPDLAPKEFWTKGL
jgi:hypothetical protein